MANEVKQFQQQQIMGSTTENNSVMAAANSSREMEEVKGQILMAKMYPRNTYQAQKRIEDACKRPTLAGSALYSYPRGGKNVTGPSIRLAEVLAQNWGNISFGFKELEQNDGESTAMAYAWDVETNTRQERIFQVPHQRKANGNIKPVTDPRDIYELIANNASRRVRACILSIIPGDIIEDAIRECNNTLRGNNNTPLKDRLAHAFDGFNANYSVTQSQIETYFGYPVEQFTEKNLSELASIANSLNDHMSSVDDWFDPIKSDPKLDKTTDDLTDQFKKDESTTKKSSKGVSKNDQATTKAADDSEQGKLL